MFAAAWLEILEACEGDINTQYGTVPVTLLYA